MRLEAEDVKPSINRLKRAQGQLNTVIRMLEGGLGLPGSLRLRPRRAGKAIHVLGIGPPCTSTTVAFIFACVGGLNGHWPGILLIMKDER